MQIFVKNYSMKLDWHQEELNFAQEQRNGKSGGKFSSFVRNTDAQITRNLRVSA